MVASGLVDEVHALWSRGELGASLVDGIGYKELVAHFEGYGAAPRFCRVTRVGTLSGRPWTLTPS